MVTSEISLLKANTLELHYWFNDNTHTMDAFIQNKCERDFLDIINEVAKTFDIAIIVETEPLSEGGIKRWFKVISKNENSKAIITTALITAFTTGVIFNPIGTTFSEIGKQLIEKVFEDKDIKILGNVINNLK